MIISRSAIQSWRLCVEHAARRGTWGQIMGLFKKAVNEQAFAKFGILGFPGSGKTFTSALLAKGIAQLTDPAAPVYMVDTESGSDFIVPILEEAGLEFFTLKSRAFSDLLTAVNEAEKAHAVLIIDSITHIWVQFLDEFRRQKGVNRLAFHHWGEIKPA